MNRLKAHGRFSVRPDGGYSLLHPDCGIRLLGVGIVTPKQLHAEVCGVLIEIGQWGEQAEAEMN